MRILIIEDDAQTAGFVAKGLQQAGFRTCHAADGLDGLFKAKTEPFDLAVIDIMSSYLFRSFLPRMSCLVHSSVCPSTNPSVQRQLCG